jgi:hypothetical protein
MPINESSMKYYLMQTYLCVYNGGNKNMELLGVEPRASCMLSTRSTN